MASPTSLQINELVSFPRPPVPLQSKEDIVSCQLMKLLDVTLARNTEHETGSVHTTLPKRHRAPVAEDF